MAVIRENVERRRLRSTRPRDIAAPSTAIA